MDYKRFQIGTLVQANKTITVEYDAPKYRKVFEIEGSILGRIVGLKRFYIGTYKSGETDFMNGDVKPNYLLITGTIVVWEIKQGKFNKPIYALDKDVIESIESLNYHLPILYQNKYVWTKKDRQMLRDDMKDVPRDSKGRWIKC